MIETIQTRQKCLALKWNSKFLCSSIDPIQEAQKWVEKNSKRFSRQSEVIVLGVGAGYHLVALQKRFPNLNITALDTNQEVINFASKEHALDMANVKLVHVESLSALKKNMNIKKILTKQYDVLSFNAACSSNLSIYSELNETLIGRSAEAFHFILSCRKDIKNIFDVSRVELAPHELLSIKSLEKSLTQNASEKYSAIVHLLRELVA